MRVEAAPSRAAEWFRKYGVIAAAAGGSALALTGCGDGGKKVEVITKTVTAPPRANWVRPPSIKERPTMTADECYANWWEDVDGRRQPLTETDPPEVRIDGRCNAPLSSDQVSIYDTPEQKGKAALVAVNGQEFYVRCYTSGESIQDVRGRSSASDIWLGLITDDGSAQGRTRYVPEVNVGYVDENQLPPPSGC